MKVNYIIISILFAASCLCVKPARAQFDFEASSIISDCYSPGVSFEEYTYVRVMINGVWWIYVYNSDGALVDKYIDPAE